MKPVTKGARRLIRLFLLVACAGGLLAADNSWLGNLSLDFVSTRNWFSSAAVNNVPDLPVAVNTPIEIAPRAEMSMSQLLNGLLFSRPEHGWRLASFDSPKRQPGVVWVTQESYNSAADPQFVSTSFSSSAVFSSRSLNAPLDPDGGPPLPGLTGHWISNASGSWGTATNWQSGTIPSGPNSKAHFDTLDITTAVTVTTTSRSVGELYIGDTDGTHSYTIAPASGASLTFDNAGGSSVLSQSSTSAGDNISVPLLLNNDLVVSNASATNPLTITGSIASSGGSGTFQTLSFGGGEISVTGDISNGSTGAIVSVQVSGQVDFSGQNTYTGQTFVTGELFVKGDNSGATGLVQVAGGGSVLSGIGTVGGPVTMFGGTITGGTTTDVGTLTLNQSLDITTSEGGGGIYLANLSGDLSDLLAISGNLHIGSGTTLNIQGAADGTTTYTLATFGSLNGMFDFVTGLPVNYALIYNPTDIELVPIPEPGTWIGAALALSAIAFRKRRRARSCKLEPLVGAGTPSCR